MQRSGALHGDSFMGQTGLRNALSWLPLLDA